MTLRILFLKLINDSYSVQPINELYLGQVDESGYPVKHKIKFIWDQKRFSSEIKHLHLNEQ